MYQTPSERVTDESYRLSEVGLSDVPSSTDEVAPAQPSKRGSGSPLANHDSSVRGSNTPSSPIPEPSRPSERGSVVQPDMTVSTSTDG